MVAHAAETPGSEVCGLLLGRGNEVTEVRRTANVAADPTRTFEVDPIAHFAAMRAARSGRAKIIGHYHSHPGGSVQPSATDAAMIALPGEFWVIVAGAAVGAWRTVAGKSFVSVDLAIGPLLASPPPVGQSTAH